MRSLSSWRGACFAPILLAVLGWSGCPGLNTQPDYMARQNGQFSVADPLPAAWDNETGPGSGAFDHASLSIRTEGELSDQTRPAR
jgi:hypothetical protein